MGSPLPPDPYLALGVSKDATQAAIKTVYRKLVLKCHPDKVTDPQAKQAASDQFHKIQTAYEILIDQDRRERYDAQVRLAELRKEALERQGSKSSRGADRSAPSPYKSSQDSGAPRGAYSGRSTERVTPQYEERRPAYATDYFDAPPRPTARKEHDHERSSRRHAPESKEKVRAAVREAKEKELERERRREKARRADQNERRNRDRKVSAAYVEDDSDSDSDDYARRARKMREEDEMLRKAKDAYNEQVYRQSQQASSGQIDDPRTKKMFAATSNAWDYIRASSNKTQESRPAPSRHGSSKEKLDDYVRVKDGRPVQIRRGSERPKTSSRDSDRRTSPREPERRLSDEFMEAPRQKPSLNQSRSSPADIRLPTETEKPRAQSVQIDKGDMSDIPQMKRADTMPNHASRRAENAPPSRSRRTEFSDGLATPATTPDYAGGPVPASAKFSYGSQYADDREYPTPEGYRTEVRQPPEGARPRFTRKVTRSPSPMKDGREPRDQRESRDRERMRTTASRYGESPRPVLSSTRTTSYLYTPSGVEQIERSRPASTRGQDPRDPRLFGEIRPSTGSGSPQQKYSPYDSFDEPAVRYTRRPEDIRVQSGYSYKQRPSTDRPTLSRNGSGGTMYTAARG